MIATAFRLCLVAFVLNAVLPSSASAQFSSSQSSDSESGGDDSSSKKPPAALAMEVWVVTLRKVTSLVDDDQFGKTLAAAANLPTDLGDRNDVHKLVERWDEQGVVHRLENYRATARSGQVATIVPTEQSPMVVGTSFSDRGKTNNIELRQTGTSLRLKPTVVGEHSIDVDVEYESSELFESENVQIADMKGGEPQPAVGAKSVSIQTVVPIPNGHAVLVTFLNDSKQTPSKLVLIAAELLEE